MKKTKLRSAPIGLLSVSNAAPAKTARNIYNDNDISTSNPQNHPMKKIVSLILFLACLTGFKNVGFSQTTNWNAYNDFYFDSTNYVNNSPPSTPPVPTSPTAAGEAWGYYDCNINLTSGYPPGIGTYFGPGGDTGAGEVLYAMANHQPLGSGQGQLGGGVPGSADAWDATGGSGWARYGDYNSWGTSVGEYGGAWYSGAPGYGTSHAGDTGLYLQPAWLGNSSSEGIGNVVTWTAPSDATYVFTCSFLISSNDPGNDYAVVDSTGGIEVPKTIGVSGTYNEYSFTNTFHAGDVVEFQVGSATNAPAAVGFNCDITLVKITDWNAYHDFYYDSIGYPNHSPGSKPPYPATPSATGASWGYYDCNVNGFGGFPTNIGTYFGPGNNTALGQVLMAMANYQPLGAGQGQIGGVTNTGSWDATPGTGLALYGDGNGWGSVVGEYGGAWYAGAPGYGTDYANQGGMYLHPGYLGVTFSDGIGNVVTWTAPEAGTYNFNGYFLTADNDPGCAYAVVDSTGGIDVPRTVAAESTYNSFSFQKALNAGDVVEFQVGCDGQPSSYVGFNCIIDNTPVPAALVSASRSLTNASQIILKFDAPLYAPSVSDLANYSIDGVTVTSAELSPTDPTTIILTISSAISYPISVTVNGVENDYGQLPVAANSMALITVPLYVPLGMGTPTSGAQDTFSGSTLDPHWESGIVNDDNNQSDYVFSEGFVQSNGVLHVHANNLDMTPANWWDPNYLIYVDPAYEGSAQEALIHFTIKNSNFSSTGVAGIGVGVQPDPYVSNPEGGNCLRAVPGGYAGVTNYPFFLTCSDFIADNNPSGIGDVYHQPWRVGGSYWLRIRQDIDTNPITDGTPGGIISTKAWAGDGSEPEPSDWQSIWKDPGGITREGYAAIRAGFGVGVIMDFDVDYFLVAANGLPTITPTLPSSLLPQVQLGIAVSGDNTTLSWPSGIQASYILQSATSLTDGDWSNVDTSSVNNSVQNWDAYKDFYFDSTNYINNSPGTLPSCPISPSTAGKAWGYYDCNISGTDGFPGSIGTYFGPGQNAALGECLMAMANYQPLGPGQGQIAGGIPGSTDAWDATVGSGWARYHDGQGWATSIGEYGGAWYSGAPGYGTSHASDTGLLLVPTYGENGTNEGIGNVVTWTAPTEGIYIFSGSFLVASNNPGSSYAIVDSNGGVELPKTVGVPGSYNTFSFEKTLKAGDVIEFQVGTDGQTADRVGFNCSIQLTTVLFDMTVPDDDTQRFFRLIQTQ